MTTLSQVQKLLSELKSHARYSLFLANELLRLLSTYLVEAKFLAGDTYH